MSIRAMLRGLSEQTDIKFETLRNRWKSGYRGDQLLCPIGERMGKRKCVQTIPRVARPHALPVRVPDSYRYR